MDDKHLTSTAESPKRYDSVGGWLLFFCIGLVILSPLRTIGNAYNNSLSVEGIARDIRAEYMSVSGQVMSMESSERRARKLIEKYKQNPELKRLFIWSDIEQVVYAVAAIFSFIVGCMLWAREPSALKWVKIYLWAILGIGAIDCIAFLYLSNPTITELLGSSLAVSGVTVLFQSSVFFGVWYSYLLKSKRVKGTFPDYAAAEKLVRESDTAMQDDEHFYEQVAAELRDGNRKEGLWLKAQTQAEGNGDKTQALYVKWRVKQLVEEEQKKQADEHEVAGKRDGKQSGLALFDSPKRAGMVAIVFFATLFGLIYFVLNNNSDEGEIGSVQVGRDSNGSTTVKDIGDTTVQRRRHLTSEDGEKEDKEAALKKLPKPVKLREAIHKTEQSGRALHTKFPPEATPDYGWRFTIDSQTKTIKHFSNNPLDGVQITTWSDGQIKFHGNRNGELMRFIIDLERSVLMVSAGGGQSTFACAIVESFTQAGLPPIKLPR